jgi:hypothetical protein
LKLVKGVDYIKDDYIVTVSNTVDPVNPVVLKSDFTRNYLTAVSSDEETLAKTKAAQTVEI